MRWLQWSTIDLKNGMGGVEVHAQCLARELEKKGVNTAFSNDPADLDDPKWNVILTHGSSFSHRGKSSAIRIHTLHGTTLGRMAACGEWTWPGGYAAAFREWKAVRQADIVMAVHPKLWLFRWAQTFGKATEVCWNGWDSGDAGDSLDPSLSAKLDELDSFWIFVGRGKDPVKGADRLQKVFSLLPSVKWVAAPGDGFEKGILKTGPLTPGQVRALMMKAGGLVIPSTYEGLPLVALEALACGLPVVSTRVGGMQCLSSELEGLIFSDSKDPRALADAVGAAQRFSLDQSGRQQRAKVNQTLLPTWKDVAENYLDAIQRLHQGRLENG